MTNPPTAVRLFRLAGTVRRDPAIDDWFDARQGELGALASHWFGVMRDAGEDVREVLHDGCPVACIADVAFGYVNVFKDHVNVGFYNGSSLDDPEQLLEGSGKFMRHVKVWPHRDIGEDAMRSLVHQTCADIRRRLEP